MIIETVFDKVDEILTSTGIEVCVGYAEQDKLPRQGIVNLLPIPSSYNNRTGISYDLFQVDIWHEDIYKIEEVKTILKQELSEHSETSSTGIGLVFFIENDNGVLREQEDEIWHGIMTIGVRYAIRN